MVDRYGSGAADQPRQGALSGHRHHQGRGVRLLRQHRRRHGRAYRRPSATRKRWPNGVDEPSFFEKQLASSAPDWLHRGTIVHKSGTTTYPIIDTPRGLAWIAQQAALEVHVPQWRFVRRKKPGPATRIVFDLDPGEGVTMRSCARWRMRSRDLMGDIGLTHLSAHQRQQGPASVRAARGPDQLARRARCSPNAWRSNWRRPCPSWSPPP